MTHIRDLLVHVNDDVLSVRAVELGASLAAQSGAKVTALVVVAPLSIGMGLSAETASLAHQLQRAQRSTLLGIGEELAVSVRQRLDVSVELRVAEGDPVEALQAHARATDLMIISQRDPAGEGGLSPAQAARLLMGASCPVLTVPHIGWDVRSSAPHRERILSRALVAWSDTRESARALRDALPLLVAASQVELVSFADADRSDVSSRHASLQQASDYLARHGVPATTTLLHQAYASLGERMQRGWMPDVAVAEALLSHAADTNADFIVMGGYSHSRLRELVLGGVTRTMMETMTVPVLMSH